ncbi:MAG TPA: hypothetical protein VFI92_00115 [Steroidobacteraceae bacterium]|nr:hypothetical protein [Steroidobacteraceae bacterium]
MRDHGDRRGVLPFTTQTAPRNKDWGEALRSATQSGAIAAGTVTAAVAVAGARDSGSAVAPLNATSHIAWGESAGAVESVDAKHTLLGMTLNAGACVFWATFYEKWFGRAAERGDVGAALLGGAAVATAAYVTDYHLVPKRLTPGWESRISRRSLAAAYVVLALSLPLRGLLQRRR